MSTSRDDDEPTAALVRNLIRRKRLQATLPLETWARALQQLAAFDRAHDARRSRWGCTAAVLIPVAVASFFLQDWKPITGGLVLLALALVRYLWLRRVDLSNDCRALLVPLVEALREDFRADRAVTLRLDLRGATKDKIIRRGKVQPPPQNTRIKSLTQTVYADPWCRLDGQLANGHRLRLAVTNTYVQETKFYRASSGKYKSKTKWRKTVVVRTALAPTGQAAFDERVLSRSPSVGHWKGPRAGHQRFGCLTRKFKFKNENAGVPPPKDVVAMLFALCASVKPEGTSDHAQP